MKIFLTDNNYSPLAGNKSIEPSLIGCAPVICEIPDTALLKDGRPFFIPDFASPCSYRAALVVRICRLGRCISPRFAHRYYDAATVGIAFTADNLLEQCRAQGLPWDISKGFDNSAAIGRFVTATEAEHPFALPVRVEEDGRTVQEGSLANANFSIDELVAYISRFYLLRQGDLIYTGFPCPACTARLDTRLTAWLGDEKVLSFNVK